ncbi:hypothetical protein FHT85_001454 [Rhizobium sp. BK312]|jgi:hypothetical protein|nr:hypothetical protein [Rhizobium sp. BK312]
MGPARYCAVRDTAWSWSVLDASTGRVAAYNNVILAGLSERLAEDMAKLLNVEYSAADTKIFSSSGSREI